MFLQRVIGGFPAVEFHGAEEALHVVGRFLGGFVEEAGACELVSRVSINLTLLYEWMDCHTCSAVGYSCGHSSVCVFFLPCDCDDARRLVNC
jgi:hypothetical protein